MGTEEILKFCLREGLLVDKDVLSLFDEEDFESAKLFIGGLKSRTGQKVITRSLFEKNKEKVSNIFFALPDENKKCLETLKIKLGLNIEISKEIVRERKVEKISESQVKILTNYFVLGRKIEVPDFVNYFRNRFLDLKKILQERPELENLVSLNKISGNNHGISIIGLVTDKKTTKNGNLVFEIEDLTGKIKILINSDKKELLEIADEISLDSVMGFKGSGNREILFANEIIFPEARLHERKKSSVEEYALFIGDFHYGSKRFLKESFEKFISYLNGEVLNTPEVNKIKYLFLVGDAVTGIGNYPEQENDLLVDDLEKQFSELAVLLGKIRKDIKIIISPGNHDAIRIMEPQPIFNEKYAWPLYELPNVIITENPCYVNIASRENFEGFNVLTYHGFSFFYYTNNIPSLIKEKAAHCPEMIMKYLLKNRHLAPAHGSTQYFPMGVDPLLIREVPDIFVSGHTHKSGISYYNNILVVSVSGWESTTPYQVKTGMIPDFCKVPMVNLKTREIKVLDFEDKEEREEMEAIHNG